MASNPSPALPDETQPESSKSEEEIMASNPSPALSDETQPGSSKSEEDMMVSNPSPVLPDETQPGSLKSEEDVLVSNPSPALPEETQLGSSKRTRRKPRTFCIYCRKFTSVLRRHLAYRHSTEDDVKTFLALPPMSKERMTQLKKIKGLGHKAYNESLNEGDTLLVARQGKSKAPRLPCPSCQMLYTKSSFRNHVKRCQSMEGIVPRHALKDAKRNLLHAGFRATKEETIKLNTKLSARLQGVVAMMRTDDVQSVILTDDFLITYGNYLCKQKGTDKHSASLISQKLRRLAGVYMDMKAKNKEIESFIDLFDIDVWDLFVEVIKQRAGWDERAKQFNSPSVINHIGNDTSVAAEFAETKFRKSKNTEMQVKIGNWLKAKERRFHAEIGKSGLEETRRKKLQKNALLPLTEDIEKLNDYVQSQIEKSKSILLQKYDSENWINLNEKIMTQMIIFNRRGVGEVEKILLDVYRKKRQKIQNDTKVYQSLSAQEKIRAEQYERIEVRGKLNRPVSLFLTKAQIHTIDIILKYRKEAGVASDNIYLFAKGNFHFRVSPALKKCANECGAKEPHLLTGPALRNHIAYTCQVLNTADNDMPMVT